MAETPQPPSKRPATGKEILKQRVETQFSSLLQQGYAPNEAAVAALAWVKAETANAPPSASAASAGEPAASTEAVASMTGSSSSPTEAVASMTGSSSSPTEALPTLAAEAAASAKYGALCLGLAGPFQSICVMGEPRPNKRLLVLDIDHTLYDPSQHGGTKAAVVTSDANGFFDESVVARCRPGLHDFMTEAYKEYDIMVWSASEMTRILKLLQQLGLCGAGHSDYRLLAVLDIDSMSDISAFGGSSPTNGQPAAAATEAVKEIVLTVTVPAGAMAGQQIDVMGSDGTAMVVMVPAGLKTGDTFCVAPPGAMSSASEEHDVDVSELQLALQLSMGNYDEAQQPAPPIQRARKRGRHIKPLSLIWACSEFSHLYNEKNTVIVDDTIDVCRGNPHNSIQCTRYFWKDHAHDQELPRLTRYLLDMAQLPAFPPSHECWRDRLS